MMSARPVDRHWHGYREVNRAIRLCCRQENDVLDVGLPAAVVTEGRVQHRHTAVPRIVAVPQQPLQGRRIPSCQIFQPQQPDSLFRRVP